MEDCKGNLVGRGNTEHSSQYLFWIILIFVTPYPPPWREYNIDNGGQGGSVSHCLIGSRWLFVHFVSKMELKTHYCMGEEESQCLSIIFNLEGYISYLSFALKKKTQWPKATYEKSLFWHMVPGGQSITAGKVWQQASTAESWGITSTSARMKQREPSKGELRLGTFRAHPTDLHLARFPHDLSK